jgi:hypothetical protein
MLMSAYLGGYVILEWSAKTFVTLILARLSRSVEVMLLLLHLFSAFPDDLHAVKA